VSANVVAGTTLRDAVAESDEDLTALQIFPLTNWWNLDIRQAPVDPRSGQLIDWISGRDTDPNAERTLHPDFVRGEVYNNLVIGLSVPAVAVFYLAAMLALSLHLSHGVWSLFQTLGVSHPHLERCRRRLAMLLAIVVPAGFAAIPLAVLLGWLR